MEEQTEAEQNISPHSPDEKAASRYPVRKQVACAPRGSFLLAMATQNF